MSKIDDGIDSIENEINNFEEEVEKDIKANKNDIYTPPKLKKTDLAKLKKLYNKRAYGTAMETQYKLTSCIPLDLGLTNGKGIPRGAAIMLYAKPGTGKSTLVADMLQRILSKQENLPENQKEKVLYIDTEGSRELLVSMGLRKYTDDGTLILMDLSPMTFDTLELIYEAVVQEALPEYVGIKYIIIDSITRVTSQVLLDKSVTDGDFGSNAKERGKFYPKFFGRCKEMEITQFFISQVRCKQDAMMFGPKYKAAVSDMDKHNMDIIAELRTDGEKLGINERIVKTSTGEVKEKDRFRIVLRTEGGECKNRYGKVPPISILVEPGIRVINAFNLDNLLRYTKQVSTEGSVSTKLKFTLDDLLLDTLNLPEHKGVALPKKEYLNILRRRASAIEEYLDKNGLFIHCKQRLENNEEESSDGM